MKKKTIIITPVYREDISNNELLSIKSTQRYLSDYERVIIAPKKFATNSNFVVKWNLYGYKIAFFDNKYFKNTDSYNKLMLSPIFYRSFNNYQYMLIVQLDVLIFSNSLHNWLEKEIDYIGAPWVVKDHSGIHFEHAGNGGLSLRKIDTFIKVLESKKLFKKPEYMQPLSCRLEIKYILLLKVLLKIKYLNLQASIFRFFYKGNEDYFWTFFAPFFLEKFNIANTEVSVAFSFERYPEFCFKQNNFSFPFGVHAWEKYNPNFWRKHKSSLFLQEKESIPEAYNTTKPYEKSSK